MTMLTYIAAAAACIAAPAVLAQSAVAPAGSVAEDSALWPSCSEKLMGNETHSLLDITMMAFTQANGGDPSVLLPLVDEVSAETLAILGDFDLSGEGYTLLLPFNMGKDGQALTSVFPEINSTEFLAAADDILRAHVLPGTVLFADIEAAANKTGEYTIESLQGFEWTFGWDQGDGGGFPYIVDKWDITTEGAIEIQTDLRNKPDCPNTVIGINGFVVTPELLEEAPAPAAEAADEDATRDLPPTTPDTPPEEDSATGTFRNLLAASAAGAAVLAAMVM